MTTRTHTLNERFYFAYVTAALWSSTDESDERGGEPMDRNYGIDDLAPETAAAMRAECDAFIAANGIPGYNHSGYSDVELAGHDFWLTRNGHGAGFWDGDLPEDEGQRLTDAAHKAGERNLYVGDDGLIYQA